MKTIGDSIWLLTNQLQNFIAGTGQPNDVKYRILTGSISQLTFGTGCDLRSGDATFSTFGLSRTKANNLQFDRLIAASEMRPMYFPPSTVSHVNRRFQQIQQNNRPISLSNMNNYMAQLNSWQRTFTIPRYNEANIFNF